MSRKQRWLDSFALYSLVLCASASVGCGDDDGGSEADRLGVGAECQTDDDCLQSTRDGGISQQCLPFKGGYCGIEDCASDEDCPERSACVAHDDGTNYCFRLCGDKPECNLNRSLENEANCSSSIDWVADDNGKACVPPSASD